jgi:hypothetical protein
MWKPTGKTRLERHRRRWQYTIKMDLQESGCADVNWIKLAQDRYTGQCRSKVQT